MTVVVQARDRCRICFSLLVRDRSICCQKSYDLFKNIERRKFPINKLSPFQIKLRNQTVCFRDLIIRYLHTQIHQANNFSNFICHDCSMVLLDIEQCAKYLRKTINQLKIKFNRSNRLRTSSLSATFQKKRQQQTSNNNNNEEPLATLNSDSDDEFDDIDDDDTEVNISNDVKSHHFTSSASNSSSSIPLHGTNMKINNGQYNDDDDEDGLIKPSSEKCSQENSLNTLSGLNGLVTRAHPMNSLEESNPNLMQLRLAHMMATAASMNSTNTGQNRNDNVMNTLANMQRNFFLQCLGDPMAAAQAVQAAVSASHMKTNSTVNNKQIGSCRKRKSTPEKRVLTNHRSSNNNNTSDTSSTNENELLDNHQNTTNDHPLELTVKPSPAKSTTDIHNIVMNSKVENGSPTYHQNYLNQYQTFDDDRKDLSTTANDSALSVSPSLIRRTGNSKRQKISTTDLLSPNHHPSSSTLMDDTNLKQQQRKLDPRTCTECGKVLFNDKTLLLHCQTHAKNEKQCWICGMNDDDIKKHILNEHGNQKCTSTGFKCQHCEKVFPIYVDLETHTREHTKKKPFECSICHKRFGQQGNLSCHLRIHSGVKPFTCASCGKAFRHSNSLRRHARTVHSASRGLTMSPGSSMATASSSSIRLTNTTTSNSMVSMANDMHHLSTSETFDEGNSGLMIPSDDAESLQGPPSTSSADAPSPNAQVDSDSHEQFGIS